ncbi:unnamed protein product [Miscanthus lutarioriparius]|uniref:Protein kinase domain-containing protein n=1 Tax=Miscanthus lutarioriparius TaxID=422564 RepID=A0A811N6B5_9POAL|nr:unnamed protein product [Miscanthus lutarioriparius]
MCCERHVHQVLLILVELSAMLEIKQHLQFTGNRTLPLSKKTGNRMDRVLATILPIVVMLLAIVIVCYFLWRMKRKPAGTLSLIDSTNPEDIRSINSLIIDLPTLRATTENFDEGKKLGEGGFGAVYKGILPNGREIAVKRLSQSSRQGIKELETELVLVAKLQHKSLIRLVGVCLEEHEKLLVYEYMPNKSLDTFLFGTVIHHHLATLKQVWEHWTMGTTVEIMDPSLCSHNPSVDQMLRCIHIGLLCVQHNPVDRPLMSTVNVMLRSSTMPSQAPSRPAFCFLKSGVNSEVYHGRGIAQSTSRPAVSENEVTITEIEAR